MEKIITGISYVLKNEYDEKIESHVSDIMPLIEWVKDELYNYWNNVKSDGKFKDTVNGYIKELIYHMVKSSYGVIGIIIKKVLNNMTDESLNDFIQLKAGNELNWIRLYNWSSVWPYSIYFYKSGIYAFGYKNISFIMFFTKYTLSINMTI